MFEKHWLNLILVAGLCLLAFYPCLNANVIYLDDAPMVFNLNNPDKDYSIKKLFVPKRVERYYRPLLMASFVVDSKIWMYEFSGYHLTNIVLHTLNALLVYWIAVCFFRQRRFRENLMSDSGPGVGQRTPKISPLPFALIVAAAFALHPLTIESVAWISGRTDVLAAFFSLAAIAVYCSGLPLKYVWVGLLFLAGLLCKESAASVWAIIVLCEFVQQRMKEKQVSQALLKAGIWATVLGCFFMVYCYLRFDGFSLLFDQKVSGVVASGGIRPEGVHAAAGQAIDRQMISNIVQLPAAVVFYFKKLFWTFPLNFAISQINVLVYWITGVIAFVGLVFSGRYRKYLLFWAVMILISFAPALPVALSDIAWTRFAERYLYLAVPVFCLFCADMYLRGIEAFPQKKQMLSVVSLLVILGFSICGVLRIQVWSDKERLWADTVKKNPENGKVLYKYGSILPQERGIQYYLKAVDVARDKEWKDFSMLAAAGYFAQTGQYPKAVQLALGAVEIKESRQNLYQAAGIFNRLSMDAGKLPAGDPEQYDQLAFDMYHRAYQLKPRAKDLANMVRLAEKMGLKERTNAFKKELFEKFPGSKAAKYYHKIMDAQH